LILDSHLREINNLQVMGKTFLQRTMVSSLGGPQFQS